MGAALISLYFLNTTDSTSYVQTTILLNGVNYEWWSKLFTTAMKTKRKMRFYDGSLRKPDEGTEEAERWEMVNSMITGWLYVSVEPKLRTSISLVNEASTMWSSLKNRYGIGDGTKEYQLHADLAACKQENDSVEKYFARLKLIWDVIADLLTKTLGHVQFSYLLGKMGVRNLHSPS